MWNFTRQYDTKAYLHAASFPTPKTTVDLNETNLLHYQDLLLKDASLTIKASGMFLDLYQRRRRKRGNVFIEFNRDELIVTFNRRDKQLVYPLSVLDTIAMAQKDNVIIYLKDGTTKMIILNAAAKASAYQFVVSMQIFKHIENMTSEGKEISPLPVSALGL